MIGGFMGVGSLDRVIAALVARDHAHHGGARTQRACAPDILVEPASPDSTSQVVQTENTAPEAV